MNTHRYLILFVLLLAALPALGQKVFVDYDRATAFSEFRTFQFKETREDLRDTARVLHERTVEQIKSYAKEGGLEEVDADPDVYIAYYTADSGNLRFVMGSLEYSYGPDFSLGGYWPGGVGTRIPDSYTFREGTLIIDVWEAAEKRLVWRGIATAAVSRGKPEKTAKKLDKALKKIMKDWEKMYGGYARQLRKHKATRDQ